MRGARCNLMLAALASVVVLSGCAQTKQKKRPVGAIRGKLAYPATMDVEKRMASQHRPLGEVFLYRQPVSEPATGKDIGALLQEPKSWDIWGGYVASDGTFAIADVAAGAYLLVAEDHETEVEDLLLEAALRKASGQPLHKEPKERFSPVRGSAAAVVLRGKVTGVSVPVSYVPDLVLIKQRHAESDRQQLGEEILGWAVSIAASIQERGGASEAFGDCITAAPNWKARLYVASMIKDPSVRVSTFSDAADSLAEKEDSASRALAQKAIAGELEAARAIPDAKDRAFWMLMVAHDLKTREAAEEALEAAEAVRAAHGEEACVEALLHLAANSEDRPKITRRAAEEAWRIASRRSGHQHPADLLASLSWICEGDRKRATAMARELKDPDVRAAVLAGWASGEIEPEARFDLFKKWRQRAHKALAIARTIKRRDLRAHAIVEISKIIADADPRWSRRLAQETLETAAGIGDPSNRAAAFLSLAEEFQLRPNGDTTGGKLMGEYRWRAVWKAYWAADAEIFTDPDDADRVLARIVEELKYADPEVAVQVALDIAEEKARADALKSIVIARLDDDQPTQAREIAAAIESPQHREMVMGVIEAERVRAAARTDPDKALQMVKTTKTPLPAELLPEIATALARKDLYRALALAYDIQDQARRASALARVASVLLNPQEDRFPRQLLGPAQLRREVNAGWRKIQEGH